jgi:uncharacterized membrane protein
MERQVNRTVQAIHPALAPAAPALLALGTGFDVLASGRAGALTWLAFWAVIVGIAAGTWRATFALLDWVFDADFGEPSSTGVDGVGTALVVGLFGVSALFRLESPAHAAPDAAMAIEIAGVALLGLKAWMGHELATRPAR